MLLQSHNQKQVPVQQKSQVVAPSTHDSNVQASDEEMLEEKIPIQAPTDFRQPRDFNEWLEYVKTCFAAAVDESETTKVENRHFEAAMKATAAYDAEDFLDILLRKHTAKHMVPTKFKER